MNRQALIIGINRYPLLKGAKGELQHLTTPARDASAIARKLELYGQFQVTRYPAKDDWEIDSKGLVETENLKNEIIRLFQPKVNIPETALLFFAGRGFRPKNEDGTRREVFLGTSDANPRKNHWGISLKWLRQVLREIPIQQQIVWLDCSYSGELFNFPTTEKNIQRCFITATGEYEEANAIKDEHGLLTQTILYCIKNNQKSLDTEVLTNYIDKEFPKNYSQHPICYSSNPIIITGTIPKKEHRLQRLWRETKGWFRNEDADTFMKHSFSHIEPYFTAGNPNQANRYRQEIERVLGGARLPETWWQEIQSIEQIHLSMRTLCGDFFVGSEAVLNNKKEISVGTAYLIALIAYQEIYNNVEPLTTNVMHWKERTQSSTSRIFPIQDAETAKESAMALYDLFYCLFDRTKSESQVINTLFDSPGNCLKIEFNWRANEPAKTGGKSLADLTSEICKNNKRFVIPEEGKTTINAILRLLANMFISERGFLSPGVVYMENNALVIASTI
jgi:hypothetical protein